MGTCYTATDYLHIHIHSVEVDKKKKKYSHTHMHSPVTIRVDTLLYKRLFEINSFNYLLYKVPEPNMASILD